MKLSLFSRHLSCTVLLLALCVTCTAEDELPSVVAPRPDAARNAEMEEAAMDEKRKSEHNRAKADGVAFSYITTIRGKGFGKVRDDVTIKVNGLQIQKFVLHDGRSLSFVIPTEIVLDKELRENSFFEISVNGKMKLKNMPMKLFVLTARKVDFEAFRKENEKDPSAHERIYDTYQPTAATSNGSPNEFLQSEETNSELKDTMEEEYAKFADVMRDVNDLLLKKSVSSSLQAVTLLDDEANRGSSLSMTTLAALYLSGDYVGVARDVSSAVSLLERAAGLGNADAQALLGFLYASGIARPHLRKDTGAAILLWRFAARAGSQFAKIALAYRYFTGTDVEERCETALLLYEQVARQVILENGKRISRKEDENAVDIRPPVPQEMATISRIRLQDDMETHFSNTQHDIVQYYRHSARRGDPGAQVVIGNFYYYGGPGIDQDILQARELFERAARAGRMDAHAHLGFMDLRAGRNASAVEHLRKAADAGQKMGHHGLGYAALHGIGMDRDAELAVEHFQQAAEAKVPEAMYNLGLIFNDGRVVPRKPKEAYRYFTEAASYGHLKARYTIGGMHARGVPHGRRDCSRAVLQFKEVAERGFWNKILSRGLRAYENGELGSALYRYLQAAHAGIEVAQYNAAFLYEHEEITSSPLLSAAGGDVDELRKTAVDEALFLYRMSAAQGHRQGAPLAMLRMGDLMYEQGTDLESAAQSYGKAAKLRNAEAMFNLGIMHALGRGLKADAYMAKRYFDEAKETDKKAKWASTLAVFALQYSDTLKHGHEVLSRFLDKSKLVAKVSLLMKTSGAQKRINKILRSISDLRKNSQNVSTDSVLVTILLAALIFIVNARQRLVLARREQANAEGHLEEDEGEVRGDGAGQDAHAPDVY